MNYKTFGQLLKALRIEKGWTQDEACRGICDKRTYLRWEKDITEPSVYYFNLLSKRFNYDLQAYYQLIKCENSYHTLNYRKKFEKCIRKQNWQELYEYIQEIKSMKDFNVGENKATLMYGLALYHYSHNKDYKTSINYCIEGLKELNPELSTDAIYDNIYSNIGLCILNCYGVNLAKLKKQEEAIEILTNILKILENKVVPVNMPYQYTEYEKRLYQTTTLNLTLNYKRLNQLDMALTYADKGIEFSNKYYYMELIGDLLELKSDVLYAIGNYKESRKAYDLCLHLYLLQNRMNHYSKCISKLDEEYSKLKDLPGILESIKN